MNINIKKTVAQIDHCLPDSGDANIAQLHKMYDLTLRLQSQLLSVIYNVETFGGTEYKRIEDVRSNGSNEDSVVTLTIMNHFPL